MSASARAWSVTERRAAWVVDIVRLQVGRVRVAPRAGARHPVSPLAGVRRAETGWCAWLSGATRTRADGEPISVTMKRTVYIVSAVETGSLMGGQGGAPDGAR